MKPEVVQVTAPYTAGGDGEISLKVGQLVHVMAKEGEWWQGELQVLSHVISYALLAS